MDWKKLFNNKYTLKFIQYYNLIILVLYTIGCYVYLMDVNLYKCIYNALISILGFNISSQIFVGYLLSKLKFCKWQTMAFFFNVVINIITVTLSLLSNYYKFEYDLLAMTILATIFTTYIVAYMIFELKKAKQKRRSKTILR